MLTVQDRVNIGWWGFRLGSVSPPLCLQVLEGGHPFSSDGCVEKSLHQGAFPERAGMMKKAFAPCTSWLLGRDVIHPPADLLSADISARGLSVR